LFRRKKGRVFYLSFYLMKFLGHAQIICRKESKERQMRAWPRTLNKRIKDRLRPPPLGKTFPLPAVVVSLIFPSHMLTPEVIEVPEPTADFSLLALHLWSQPRCERRKDKERDDAQGFGHLFSRFGWENNGPTCAPATRRHSFRLLFVSAALRDEETNDVKEQRRVAGKIEIIFD
jgi:hypothetical protein